MNSSKLCSRKRFQVILKLLLLIIVVGLYFAILLRESFAAWESTKSKTLNRNVVITRNHSFNRVAFKRILRKNIMTTSIPDILQTISTSINPVYEYSDEINLAAENDFHHRRQHLDNICDKFLYLKQYQPNAFEFIVSPGHGIAWCNIFKAASSTWMYYFNILGGYDIKYLQRTKASPLELTRKRFPRPTHDELKDALINSLSFLIVREPFERLLSAYRNKLENYRNKYFKPLAERIVKKFRTGNKRKPLGPTFKEFLLYLIDNYKNENKFDEHWAPIYSLCTPCSINYTIIVKMETLNRDSEYIIRQAGLETLLLNKLPLNKMHFISNQSNDDTSKLIRKYFSKIDSDILNDLIKIYGPDFDLFEYNSTKYNNIVQPSKPIHVYVNTSSTIQQIIQ